MGLEAATYINELVPTNPVGATDPKAQGDDHLRLIKQVLQNTFPNINGVVNATDEQLNLVAGALTGLANPTALVGPTAINGVATTAMRSDGAPAINQTANYSWTGTHTFIGINFGANAFTGVANPSVTVGLTAKNGAAATAMRSDAAPALDISIIPTWTNQHTFAGNGGIDAVIVSGSDPTIRISDTNAPANEKHWRILGNSSEFRVATLDDALSTSIIAMEIGRTSNSPTFVNFPAGVLQYGGKEVGFRGFATRRDVAIADSTIAADGGGVIVFTTGGFTFTVDTDLPVDALVTLINVSTVNVTIAGTALSWFNGAGGLPATGSRVLASSGVATVWRSSGGFNIWGVGLS